MSAVHQVDATRSAVPAVARAAVLLDVLAASEGPGMTLSELARAIGAPKSSTANLCNALADVGFLRRLDGRWGLGLRLAELGHAALARVDLIGEFRRLVAELPVIADETVLLAMLDGDEVVYLGRHDGSQEVPLASKVGRRLPAVITGVGKAMLSAQQPATRAEFLAVLPELPVVTHRSHRTVASLEDDLVRCERRGYAIDDQENTEGVMCFAVPIRDTAGRARPVGLSVPVLAARVTEALREEIVADLLALARSLAGVEGP